MNRLTDLVRRSAEQFGDAPALAPGGGAGGWTYAELSARMESGAALLSSTGLSAGEPVLLCAESCAAWPIAFFAVLEAGSIVVPLPAETPASAVAAAAALTGSRLAIVGRRTEGLAGPGLEELRLERLVEASGGNTRRAAAAADGLALLAFTSGSTSRPRAVALAHANLLANLGSLLEVRRAAPGDSFLSMLPPAHLFELMAGLLAPLACGARVVYASTLLPNRLLDAMREQQITHALAVPALLQVLYDEVVSSLVDSGVLDPDKRGQTLAETARRFRELNEEELERLRAGIRERIGPRFGTVVVGGAALDPAWREVAAAAGLKLELGYGLTEASPIVSLGLASESPPGSAGRPLPRVQVRVASDGEILVRGPGVMRGYFQDPGATADVLREGWLHTGDRGRLDLDGFLYVTGRLKEALVTETGETLCPEEVEPYYESPLFAEWCVAGIPAPQGNDSPALFVVPASRETNPAVMQRAFEEMRAAAPARARVSRMICLPGPLPRTTLGKVRRRSLGEEWCKGGGFS